MKELIQVKKPFVCKYCEKQFTKSSTLKDHKRSHTGEEPWFVHTVTKKLQAQQLFMLMKELIQVKNLCL